MYAARKVLDALGNMFVNAKSVMDWLNECARDIAQHGAFRHGRCHVELHADVCMRATRRQRVQCGGPRPWAFQWCRCGLRRGSPRSRIDCYIALQPYRKRGKRSVQTVLQTFTVSCVSLRVV